MEKVVLETRSENGKRLKATFWPEKGMNLISYKKGELEIIDQTTWPLFEERFAGLGALIGPHFHHRNPALIPPIKDESLFPHIARVKAQGIQEPFSHGIARYAPWKVESTSSTQLKAQLTGKDIWNGVALADLEGQQFKMGYEAQLLPQGLSLFLYVTSDTDSLVGLHPYFSLNDGKGKVRARVQNKYNDQGVLKPFPPSWNYDENHLLTFDLAEAADYGFYPFPDPLEGEMELETGSHKLRVHYRCGNQENSCQLWHPKDASFVCIEPLSAKNPRKPHLSSSSIKILISIF